MPKSRKNRSNCRKKEINFHGVEPREALTDLHDLIFRGVTEEEVKTIRAALISEKVFGENEPCKNAEKLLAILHRRSESQIAVGLNCICATTRNAAIKERLLCYIAVKRQHSASETKDSPTEPEAEPCLSESDSNNNSYIFNAIKDPRRLSKVPRWISKSRNILVTLVCSVGVLLGVVFITRTFSLHQQAVSERPLGNLNKTTVSHPDEPAITEEEDTEVNSTNLTAQPDTSTEKVSRPMSSSSGSEEDPPKRESGTSQLPLSNTLLPQQSDKIKTATNPQSTGTLNTTANSSIHQTSPEIGKLSNNFTSDRLPFWPLGNMVFLEMDDLGNIELRQTCKGTPSMQVLNITLERPFKPFELSTRCPDKIYGVLLGGNFSIPNLDLILRAYPALKYLGLQCNLICNMTEHLNSDEDLEKIILPQLTDLSISGVTTDCQAFLKFIDKTLVAEHVSAFSLSKVKVRHSNVDTIRNICSKFSKIQQFKFLGTLCRECHTICGEIVSSWPLKVLLFDIDNKTPDKSKYLGSISHLIENKTGLEHLASNVHIPLQSVYGMFKRLGNLTHFNATIQVGEGVNSFNGRFFKSVPNLQSFQLNFKFNQTSTCIRDETRFSVLKLNYLFKTKVRNFTLTSMCRLNTFNWNLKCEDYCFLNGLHMYNYAW